MTELLNPCGSCPACYVQDVTSGSPIIGASQNLATCTRCGYYWKRGEHWEAVNQAIDQRYKAWNNTLEDAIDFLAEQFEDPPPRMMSRDRSALAYVLKVAMRCKENYPLTTQQCGPRK